MKWPILALVIAAAALIALPGPANWFANAHVGTVIAMSGIIYAAVYFGTVKCWELLAGEPIPKPALTVLAIFLAVRLIVDSARILMWR
jgi:hypothetical protein